MNNSQSAVPVEQDVEQPRDERPSSTVIRRQRLIIIALGAIVAAVCLCIGICVAAGGWGTVTGLVKAAQEQDDIIAVIDEFMQEMEDENAVAAYALFSARVRRQIDLSVVEDMLAGSNYSLFEGYESVMVTSLYIKAAFNTDPNQAQGTIAEVAGSVTYDGGVTGSFTAVLEEEDDGWGLHYINVTVPPGKFTSP